MVRRMNHTRRWQVRTSRLLKTAAASAALVLFATGWRSSSDSDNIPIASAAWCGG
jgi:hypothetical protein